MHTDLPSSRSEVEDLVHLLERGLDLVTAAMALGRVDGAAVLQELIQVATLRRDLSREQARRLLIARLPIPRRLQAELAGLSRSAWHYALARLEQQGLDVDRRLQDLDCPADAGLRPSVQMAPDPRSTDVLPLGLDRRLVLQCSWSSELSEDL